MIIKLNWNIEINKERVKHSVNFLSIFYSHTGRKMSKAKEFASGNDLGNDI